MKNVRPIYDDSIELQLNKLICKLDEKPYICFSPVESSPYLGFKLADGDKGYFKYIKENLFDRFISYIEFFKKNCINSNCVKTHFLPVIKRLLVQYEEAEKSLYESEIRNQWSQYFNESQILNAEQILKKQTYQFFLKAAGVQILFLGKLADKMKGYLVEFESAIPKPEPEYYFSILPKFTKERHNILYAIHKDLSASGYVDCTKDEFKKVFTIKEPKPIKWLNSQRALTYFIKQLTGQLLVEKTKPSNFYIAERYLQIYKDGVLFHPKKLRHDDNPNAKDKEFLDKIINDAIIAYKQNR